MVKITTLDVTKLELGQGEGLAFTMSVTLSPIVSVVGQKREAIYLDLLGAGAQ